MYLCYYIHNYNYEGITNMKYFLLFIATILFFGCSSAKKTTSTIQTDSSSPTIHDENTITQSSDGDTVNKQSDENPPSKPNSSKEETIMEENPTDSPKDFGKPIINDGAGVVNNQDTEKPKSNPKLIKADIQKISFNGKEGQYTFAVTIKSDEIGCDQYADWWEVISADGVLLYRRVLEHSHPEEQPFIRSGTSISIKKTEKIYIRAHMSNQGFTGNTFVGSIANGFASTKEPLTFNKNIEFQDPLPQGCAF